MGLILDMGRVLGSHVSAYAQCSQIAPKHNPCDAASKGSVEGQRYFLLHTSVCSLKGRAAYLVRLRNEFQSLF